MLLKTKTKMGQKSCLHTFKVGRLKKLIILAYIIIYLIGVNVPFYSVYAQEATSSAQQSGEVLGQEATPIPTPDTNVSPTSTPSGTDTTTPTPTLTPTEASGPTPTPTPEPIKKIDDKQAIATDENKLSPTAFLSIFPSLSPASSESALSARIKRMTKLRDLVRKTFQANEKIKISVEKDIENTISLVLINPAGNELPVIYSRKDAGELTTFEISPPQSFVPGKYKLRITDSSGQTQEQDFTWGVLALNTNKSIYRPSEKAHLTMAVLDENGNMVCDAKVKLVIKKPNGQSDTLSTENKDIKVHADCSLKAFTPNPDYEAFYGIGGPGRYELTLSANTNNGDYTINDSFEVRESVPFDVERKGPTRIYPPSDYTVELNIVANEDFSGTVEEIVPLDFTIHKDEQIPYDTEEITSLKNTGLVLGASTQNLSMPFDGKPEITTKFGERYDDRSLTEKILNFGLQGHDGVDFAMKEGTVIKAADGGKIIHADDNPYGQTVIIEHDWGNSYYGHLSETTVKDGDVVSRGQEIGKSGNTGISTGPHLHFSVKPKDTDENNGYKGKVDPLTYLGIGDGAVLSAQAEYRPDVRILKWNVDLKKGDTKTLKYQFKAPNESPEFYLLGPLRFVKKGQKTGVNTNTPALISQTTPPQNEATEVAIIHEKNISTSDTGKVTGVASVNISEASGSAVQLEKRRADSTSNILDTEGITIDKESSPQAGLDFVTPTEIPATSELKKDSLPTNENNTGQAEEIVFQEARRWQIAVDNTSVERPNGDDGPNQWANCIVNGGGACGAGLRYTAINESTIDTSGYVGTGLAGAGGEIEEFDFNDSVGQSYPVTQVSVTFYADTQACNGGGTNCDTLSVDVSSDGTTYTGSPQTQTMSTISNGPYTFNFSVSWSGWANMTAKFTRNVAGTGKASSADDDVRLYMAYATVTYTPPISISGICKEFDRTTDCTDAGAEVIAVAVNGTLQGQTDGTVDGSWEITGVSGVATGDKITVFINGEATASQRASAVTKYDGTGNITGMKLYQRHLTIGSDDNATLNIDTTQLGVYDYSVSGNDADVIFDVSGFQLTVDNLGNYSDETLLILSNNNLTNTSDITSPITTHDFEIQSSASYTDPVQNLASGDSTVTVSGSFTNSGTYTTGSCGSGGAGVGANRFNFTSTASETVSGNLNGTNDLCEVTFSGSGGSWTITDPMLVSGADHTDTFVVSAGTVTLGGGADANGDNLEVRGKFTVSSGATFQTLSTLALGKTITIDINTAGGGGSGGCGSSSSNCVVALAGTMTINKNATLIFNTTNTSTTGLKSGVDITGSGTINITGALDDTGTDTGTDSLALRETKICANEAWTTNSLNNDYVQMTSGFARGKMYPITATAAADASSCTVDTDDSITRADTSTADTTISQLITSTNSYKVCATSSLIAADDQGIGRYLRDMTTTTGYYLIIDSTDTDTACTDVTDDSFVVIPDPDSPDTLSNLVVSDNIDISDGVKSGDTFNIIDMANFSGLSTTVSDFTKHTYIDSSSTTASINIQYGFLNHIGIEDTDVDGRKAYGINSDTVSETNFATAGKFYVKNSYFANFRRAIRCEFCTNAIEKYSSGFYNNYFEGVTGSTASTLPYECVETSQGRNNEMAGNRCEKTYGDGNWGAFGEYTGYTDIFRDNIAIAADSAPSAAIRSEVEANHLYLNNRIFRGDIGIEDAGGASAHKSIIAGNMIFGTASQAMALGTAASTQSWHLAGNTVGNSTVNLDIIGSPGTIIAYGEKYGNYSAASTADVRYNGTGTTKSKFYNSLFGSSTETTGISTANMYLISKMHDQTNGATAIWNDYTIPSDDSETSQDESTDKYNYANNSWEDSFTPHFYYNGVGTEDSTLNFAFSGGSLGGSDAYYVYRVVCEASTCISSPTDTWTVYRTGVSGQTSPSKFASVGTATTGTTFTDSTTNVQFKIDQGAQAHARSDTYTFMVYSDAADSNNQKSITMMQTADSFTASSGTLQLLGSTSSTPTLVQKAAAATSYGFDISGGTINANYYKFTGTDIDGLNISSGTVSNLSGGTFDDTGGSASSTYITVASTVVNAGAQTWTGMVFDEATSADSNIADNVTMTGVAPVGGCSNSWTFESSGNLGDATNGEANDNEIDADCSGVGYILWTTTTSGPTNDQLMRHGMWFTTGGVKQSFTF